MKIPKIIMDAVIGKPAPLSPEIKHIDHEKAAKMYTFSDLGITSFPVPFKFYISDALNSSLRRSQKRQHLLISIVFSLVAPRIFLLKFCCVFF